MEKELDAIRALILGVANNVLEGRTNPRAGAHTLWILGSELESLAEQLEAFRGLHSQLDDHLLRPAPELEGDVVLESV